MQKLLLIILILSYNDLILSSQLKATEKKNQHESETSGNPGQWTCEWIVDQWGAFRIDPWGDVNCLSSNFSNDHCYWTKKGKTDCENAVKNSRSKGALACGVGHKKFWGNDGYSGGWCKQIRDMYGKPSLPANQMWSCQLTVNGYGAIRKDSNGDVACLSSNFNNDNCYWTGSKDNCIQRIEDSRGKGALTCGEGHKHFWGSSGYSGSHWCQKMMEKL